VPAEELKAVMATREGGYLSFLTSEGTYREELFQRDLQVIQMAYFDRGFINVRVDKPVVSLSPDKRRISITCASKRARATRSASSTSRATC
jgi:outer membrane protein insertion porin family